MLRGPRRLRAPDPDPNPNPDPGVLLLWWRGAGVGLTLEGVRFLVAEGGRRWEETRSGLKGHSFA